MPRFEARKGQEVQGVFIIVLSKELDLSKIVTCPRHPWNMVWLDDLDKFWMRYSKKCNLSYCVRQKLAMFMYNMAKSFMKRLIEGLMDVSRLFSNPTPLLPHSSLSTSRDPLPCRAFPRVSSWETACAMLYVGITCFYIHNRLLETRQYQSAH